MTDPVHAGRPAQALRVIGRLAEAEVELRAGSVEPAQTGLPADRASVLLDVGFVLRRLGDTEGALRTSRSALALAHRAGDRYAQAYGDRFSGRRAPGTLSTPRGLEP